MFVHNIIIFIQCAKVAQNLFYIRFLETFEFCPGGLLSLDDIMEKFSEQKKNLSFHLEKREVRGFLSELFVDINVFKPRLRNGIKRCTLLSNIAVRRHNEGTYENSEMEVGEMFFGWILRSKSVDSLEMSFSRLTGIIVNDNEAVVHLKIHPTNLEFQLYSFLGNVLTGEDIGFNKNQRRSLSFTLEYLARYTVCCGIPADSYIQSVVRTGLNDKLCSEIKIGSTSDPAFVSRKCRQVVPSKGETCFECKHLKKQLHRRKKSYKNIMRTKNCLLSDQEKILKKNIKDQQRFKRKKECNSARELLEEEI